MSKTISRSIARVHLVVLSAVILVVGAPGLGAQVFPELEYLDVVRTIDGSILSGRIVGGEDAITDGTATEPITIEIYGGSQFVVVPENVESISRVRNPDFGKEAPVLRLGDFTTPGPGGEVREVRYPSFSGGIGFYAPMELESGPDRMIDGGWSAGALGFHIHSYDLIPFTLGLEAYASSQGRNGNYDTYEGTVTSTGDDTVYPYFDHSETQLVPSLLIGNHWQSIAIGATWLGIQREGPLIMPTVQWRNLRLAASLVNEGFFTAQYHLPIDARAKEARADIAAVRESDAEQEYRIDNRTWSRAFVRVNLGAITANPEIDYVSQTGTGPEERSIILDGPNHNGASVGLELNRTLWRRLDLGVGAEFGILSNNARLALEDVDYRTDFYSYRNVIGGYLRLAGYPTERIWMYGRFGMSVTEIRQEDTNPDAEDGFPKIPNHSYFPHWWSDLGVGVGFFRDRRFGVDLEAGPRFSILQTGDVTDNKDPASIGVGIQASVRRNDAPVSHRVRADERGPDPLARALGKPIWLRMAFGLKIDAADDTPVSDIPTSAGTIDSIMYRDSGFMWGVEAAVELTRFHVIGTRLHRNVAQLPKQSYIELPIHENGGESEEPQRTQLFRPLGFSLFHELRWRALGLRTQFGGQIIHVTKIDSVEQEVIYDDVRTFMSWNIGVGPNIRLAQFGKDDRNEIDLGFMYQFQWIDLTGTYDLVLQKPRFDVEIGYRRRFGTR